MTSCGGCNSKILDLYFMECTNPECALLYDLPCLNKTKEDFEKVSEEQKASWLCPLCVYALPKSDNTGTPVRMAATGALNDTFTKNVNLRRGGRLETKQPEKETEEEHVENKGECDKLSLLIKEVRLLRLEVGALKEENTQTKNLVINYQKMLKDTVTAHSTKITKLHEEVAELQSVVADLQQKNVIQEQENLRNNLEIIGIPENENESLIHLVKATCAKIGIELKNDDIDDVFRAGVKQQKGATSPPKTLSRPVVIRLVRRQKRDEILQAAKTRRNVTTDGIVDGKPQSIYFNERLTKFNRLLFRAARERAFSYKFAYCWTRNGHIFVRRSDGKPAARINSTQDLDEKIGPIFNQVQ
ncbi:hypothetical protein O0L34_g17101 [Tuta absoluta]|nr:hypothetical protein O0L34_g17101 [Tuta absoluta]